MKNTVPPVLSGLAGIALLSLSALSAAFAGFEATLTIAGISAFVLWGILVIGASEYAPSPRRHAVKPGPVPARAARVSPVVAFPALASSRRAA